MMLAQAVRGAEEQTGFPTMAGRRLQAAEATRARPRARAAGAPVLEGAKRSAGAWSDAVLAPRAARGHLEVATTFDLAEVVCDALLLRIDGWTARGITVVVAPDPSTPEVTGRWTLVTQSILYMLDHAADSLAGSTGSHIEIRTWADHGTGFVQAVDNGRGMSPDAVKRFRKPFVVVHEDRRVEAGLMLARFIAEAHGGTLAVSSIEGIGSSYRLSLPIGTPATEDDPTAGPQRVTRQRVLLVAPDPWAVRVLRRAVELGGGECQVVPNLAQVGGSLRAGEFDVVLCDVHGESEERTLMDQLAQEAPAAIARTILLTTRAQGPHATPPGPEPRVLAKPFGIADLVAEIHAIGGDPRASAHR